MGPLPEEKYLVYLATCLVSLKWYVGKTKRTEPQRWRSHLNTARAGATYAISNAIRKYGGDAFDRQIIAENLTWKQASDLERIWITLLESHKKEFGYNLTRGGDGVRHNEATRKKVSEKLTGRTYSDEAKKNMREGALRRRIEGNGIQGDFVPRADIDNADVAEMYLSGYSLPKIAKKYNTDHGCIAHRLEKMGIPRRPVRGPRTRHDLCDEELISRYQAGESTTSLAKSFGTSHETIRKRFKTAGVALRTRSEANLLRYSKPNKIDG